MPYSGTSAHNAGTRTNAHRFTITYPEGMDVRLYPEGSMPKPWLPEDAYTTPGLITDDNILIFILNKLNKIIGKGFVDSQLKR